MSFEVIKCQSGKIISACDVDYSNEIDWLFQKAYYISQGCKLGNVNRVTFGKKCDCDHHQKLIHDHYKFEKKATEILINEFLK